MADLYEQWLGQAEGKKGQFIRKDDQVIFIGGPGGGAGGSGGSGSGVGEPGHYIVQTMRDGRQIKQWQDSTIPDDYKIQVTARGKAGVYSEVSIRSRSNPQGTWQHRLQVPDNDMNWAKEYLNSLGVDADKVQVANMAL